MPIVNFCSRKEFQIYAEKMLRTFLPNGEVVPENIRDLALDLDNVCHSRKKDGPWIDVISLLSLEPSSWLYVLGNHPAARYLIRANQKNLDIWRDRDRNGLSCPKRSIVSQYGEIRGSIDEGVIRVGTFSMMPYFSYDSEKPIESSVVNPSDIWGDKYTRIALMDALI